MKLRLDIQSAIIFYVLHREPYTFNVEGDRVAYSANCSESLSRYFSALLGSFASSGAQRPQSPKILAFSPCGVDGGEPGTAQVERLERKSRLGKEFRSKETKREDGRHEEARLIPTVFSLAS